MEQELRASKRTSNLSRRLYKQNYSFPLLVRVVNLSEALVLAAVLPLSSLLLALGHLQAYMHAVRFLLELSLLALLLPSRPSGAAAFSIIRLAVLAGNMHVVTPRACARGKAIGFVCCRHHKNRRIWRYRHSAS